MDAADIVLLRPDLHALSSAFALSRRTIRIIRQNLFWAFFYNLLLIPLASGLLTPLLHIEITPVIAALFMSISSVTVCLNALRLNLFKAP